MFVSGSATVPGLTPATPVVETKPIVTGGSAYNQQDMWRTQVSTEIAGLKKQLDDYKARDADAAAKKRGADEMARLTGGSAAPPVAPGLGGEAPPAPVFAPPVPPPPGAKGGEKQSRGAPTPLFNAPAAPVPPPSMGGDGSSPRASIGSVRFDESAEQKVASALQGNGLQQLQPVGQGPVGAGLGGGGGQQGVHLTKAGAWRTASKREATYQQERSRGWWC